MSPVSSSPSVSGPGFSSRLSKRALYSYFRQVAQAGGHAYLLDLPTYRSVKVCVSCGCRQVCVLWRCLTLSTFSTGGSRGVPDGEGPGEAAVPQSPRRSMGLKEAGGLLQCLRQQCWSFFSLLFRLCKRLFICGSAFVQSCFQFV